MENKPTHISGSLMDHVYIKKASMEDFFTNITVENAYLSDHDAAKVVIEKKFVDFHINSQNLIYVTVIATKLPMTFGSKM